MKLLGLDSKVEFFNQHYTVGMISRKEISLIGDELVLKLKPKEVITELQRGTLKVLSV